MPDPAPLELIYTREARQDLQDLFDRISQDRPTAAERFMLDLKRACEGLRWFPWIGRQADPDDARVRTISVRRKVVIQYLVTDTRLHVLGFYYRGRDIPSALRAPRP